MSDEQILDAVQEIKEMFLLGPNKIEVGKLFEHKRNAIRVANILRRRKEHICVITGFDDDEGFCLQVFKTKYLLDYNDDNETVN